MVWEDLTPRKIQYREAFENAITVAMAMGLLANAIIHLIAQARRAGQDIGLDDFEIASRKVPVIANVRPSGDKYLMEDFYYAGGLPGPDEPDQGSSASRYDDGDRQDARPRILRTPKCIMTMSSGPLKNRSMRRARSAVLKGNLARTAA